MKIKGWEREREGENLREEKRDKAYLVRLGGKSKTIALRDERDEGHKRLTLRE